MEGPIVFARLRQCTTPSNTCFLEPIRVHTPNGISITGLSRFCTAHGRRSPYFTMGRPFPPQNCPI